MSLLPTRVVAKPWGRTELPAPFVAPEGVAVGEIWFEPPPQLPQLLAKYIFTSDKLSVQVHPSDDQALAAGLERQGKEECWLVIGAQPGAVLGIGLREETAAAALRAAALDGSIEDMLVWHPVTAGDFFVIPAGTIHAIGAGVTLIEIQQNSDITWRLYDYGRPRELHLEDGLAVARAGPYNAALHRRVGAAEARLLVDGPRFRLDQLAGPPSREALVRHGAAPVLVLPRAGMVSVGGSAVPPGSAAVAAALGAVEFAPDAVCLVASACG